MNRRFGLSSTLLSAVLAGVLVMFAGPGAQAAGACGSTALAHRGAKTASIDENTLESIERAQRIGAYTENDVFLTADGRFLMIHNLSLHHTTNCEGDVTDWLLADIQAECLTTPNGMALPTARQAFRTLAGNPDQLMNLEVKGPGWFDNDNAELVELRNAAAAEGVLDRVYFSNDATYQLVTAFRDSAPDAMVTWKPEPGEPDLSVEHATDLSADAVMATKSQWVLAGVVLSLLKLAGFEIWSKVSDNEAVWEANRELGVEIQLTNRPKVYMTWCDSLT